jgi:hypothetical protein
MGPLGQVLGNGPVLQIVKIVPTYYLVHGEVNAIQNLGTWSTHAVDISVILGIKHALLADSVRVLQRQPAVFAVI